MDLDARLSEKYYKSYKANGAVKKTTNVGRPPTFTSLKAIYVALIRLRRLWSFAFLAWFFTVSDKTINRTTEQVFTILHEYVTAQVLLLPSLSQRLARGQWIASNSIRVTMMLDGFLTRVPSAPTRDLRNQLHSGKSHNECISVLGIVDGSGQFIWWSNSFAGSIPDCVSTFFYILRAFVEKICSSECLVADAAFHGLSKFNSYILFPDTIDKASNSEISAVRSTIERAWASIRSWELFGDGKFRFCWGVTEDSSEEAQKRALFDQHNKMLKIVMGLHNLYHEPLNQPDLRYSETHNLRYPHPSLPIVPTESAYRSSRVD